MNLGMPSKIILYVSYLVTKMQWNSYSNMEPESMWKLECVGQDLISTIAKNEVDIPEAELPNHMLLLTNYNVLFIMLLTVIK